MTTPLDHYRQSARAALEQHTANLADNLTTHLERVQKGKDTPSEFVQNVTRDFDDFPTELLPVITTAAVELVEAELEALEQNLSMNYEAEGPFVYWDTIKARIAALTKENQQ